MTRSVSSKTISTTVSSIRAKMKDPQHEEFARAIVATGMALQARLNKGYFGTSTDIPIDVDHHLAPFFLISIENGFEETRLHTNRLNDFGVQVLERFGFRKKVAKVKKLKAVA